MPASEDFTIRQAELNITEELTLAESSRPDDLVLESDRGWRANPTAVKAYEARLRVLRGALETVDGERTVEVDIVAESQTGSEIQQV